MNLLLIAGFWVWTNSVGELEMTSIPEHAPTGAVQVDALPVVVVEPDPVEFNGGIISGNGLIYVPSNPDATNGYVFAATPWGTWLSVHWYGSPTDSVHTVKSSLLNKIHQRGVAIDQANKKASNMRTNDSIDSTMTNKLAIISRSSGNATRDATVDYLEWLTTELQALREQVER